MRIKIIRATVVDGVIVTAGETLCLENRLADYLIALGKAQECAEPELTEDEKAEVLANPMEIAEKAIKSAPEKRKR